MIDMMDLMMGRSDDSCDERYDILYMMDGWM